MNIQWYPGHMTKARRAMEADLKLVDLIIELVDARLPQSSRNPDIDRLGQGKARLILLNKADLADEAATAAWEEWFAARGFFTVKLDARKRSDMKAIHQTIEKACREKTERDRRRGILNRPVRAMVVGIPNVGKSTFINSFVGKASAKTGNRPGVTKGNQWIRMGKNVELLDTPGILWPRFEDKQVGVRLALVGSINDNILNLTELAGEGLTYLSVRYPGALARRYAGEADAGEAWGQASAPYELLAEIARARNCLQKGGEPDLDKAAAMFLEDLRSGRLGRISLEWPQEERV